MAFAKKVEKTDDNISVREAVAKLGDYWRYSTIHALQGIRDNQERKSEALLMSCYEEGRLGRVSDYDVAIGSRLLIEDRILDEEKAAARAYDDIDADEPDQDRTAADDAADDPRMGLAESIRRGLA